MQKTLLLVLGAASGIALVATCDGKMMPGTGDAGAQAGPARVLTADTDSNQLVAGGVEIAPGVPQKLADGPIVVTDVGGEAVFFVATDCSAQSFDAAINQGKFRVVQRAPNDVAATRIFVAAGQAVCAGNNGATPRHAYWSGFKPY